MTVHMKGRLLNSTSCEIVHGPSGARIQTTAPKDNGGDGSCFSPTDLCAASLGVCAATIVGMYAVNNNIQLEGIDFDVEKEMASSPRRIFRIVMTMKLKTTCSEEEFHKLIAAARACPVSQSLSEKLEIADQYIRV